VAVRAGAHLWIWLLPLGEAADRAWRDLDRPEQLHLPPPPYAARKTACSRADPRAASSTGAAGIL